MSIKHLQTEKPTLSFEDWYGEVIRLFSDAWEIEQTAVVRRLSLAGLKEWYDDGFTPYATFRETYQPIL
jgi:hypothetical protein